MTKVNHNYSKTKIAELLTKNELEHCSVDIARVFWVQNCPEEQANVLKNVCDKVVMLGN